MHAHTNLHESDFKKLGAHAGNHTPSLKTFKIFIVIILTHENNLLYGTSTWTVISVA